MMVEKEKGELKDPQFPALWIETDEGAVSGKKM
jgi:hypothetical protein